MIGEYNKKQEFDKINLQLRRSEVLRYATMGLTQDEIAEKVKISQPTVSLDLQYLECMAKEKMKEHIDTTIPVVHDMCVNGLKLTLKKVWNSVVDKDGKDRTDLRPTELTQKLSLIAELYEKIYKLSTEGPTLTRAMEIVRLEKERLRILEERYGSHSTEEEDNINTQELQTIKDSISKLEPDIVEEEDIPNEDNEIIEDKEEEVIEEETT